MNEINIDPFRIYAGAFQKQLLYIKIKYLWGSEFKEVNSKIKEL